MMFQIKDRGKSDISKLKKRGICVRWKRYHRQIQIVFQAFKGWDH